MELHYASIVTDSRTLEILLCILIISFLRRLRPTR